MKVCGGVNANINGQIYNGKLFYGPPLFRPRHPHRLSHCVSVTLCKCEIEALSPH